MITTNLINPKSVLIVGAGPNGLSAAISLRTAGAEVAIHGSPMDTWRNQMPKGMILRSSRISSSIASPGDKLSIDQFERQTGAHVDFQPTLEQFLAYTRWYHERGVPGIDETRVKTIERNEEGFISILEDGRFLKTKSVVLAPGITLFPYIPPEFNRVPKSLASHPIEHSSFDRFNGKEVVVIGKGQSALESAALLHECGAKVEILTRGVKLTYIYGGGPRGIISKLAATPPLHEFLYPPTDLAGPPDNWAIADPAIYRKLSKSEQAQLFVLIGPIGSTNLEARLEGVQITTQVTVRKACEQGQKLYLELLDGTHRVVDHAIIATGFRPDIRQCNILSPGLLAAIDQEEGYPKLTLGFESTSVKGFYVTGALAGLSQGPITRFVCGTYPLMQYMTEAMTGSRIGYPDPRTLRMIAGRRMMYQAYQFSRPRS